MAPSTVAFLTGMSHNTLNLSDGEHRMLGVTNVTSESAVKAFKLLQRHFLGITPRETPSSARPKSDSFHRLNYSDISIAPGIDGFQRDFGCLPPRAICDPDGKPLLSWRVMLLPYLGYENLFALFRLDQPWDSRHNKRLLPFMPSIFKKRESVQRDAGQNDHCWNRGRRYLVSGKRNPFYFRLHPAVP